MSLVSTGQGPTLFDLADEVLASILALVACNGVRMAAVRPQFAPPHTTANLWPLLTLCRHLTPLVQQALETYIVLTGHRAAEDYLEQLDSHVDAAQRCRQLIIVPRRKGEEAPKGATGVHAAIVRRCVNIGMLGTIRVGKHERDIGSCVR